MLKVIKQTKIVGEFFESPSVSCILPVVMRFLSASVFSRLSPLHGLVYRYCFQRLQFTAFSAIQSTLKKSFLNSVES